MLNESTSMSMAADSSGFPSPSTSGWVSRTFHLNSNAGVHLTCQAFVPVGIGNIRVVVILRPYNRLAIRHGLTDRVQGIHQTLRTSSMSLNDASEARPGSADMLNKEPEPVKGRLADDLATTREVQPLQPEVPRIHPRHDQRLGCLHQDACVMFVLLETMAFARASSDKIWLAPTVGEGQRPRADHPVGKLVALTSLPLEVNL